MAFSRGMLSILFLLLVSAVNLVTSKVVPLNYPINTLLALPAVQKNSSVNLFPRLPPGCDLTEIDEPDVPKCRPLCAPSQDACSGEGLERRTAAQTRRSVESSTGPDDSKDHHHVKRALDDISQASLGPYIAAQFDNWDEYFGPPADLVEVDDDDDETDATVTALLQTADAPLQVGTRGLYGCTVVTVVSNRAVYMGHFWENPNWGNKNYFSRRVLNWISGDEPREGVGAALDVSLFNGGDSDNTRIYIMHPRRTGASVKAYQSPNYRTKLPELKNLLLRLLPNTPMVTWHYHPVLPSSAVAQNNPHRGKAVFQYDPDARGDGIPGWRLFYENHLFQDTDPTPGPESANGIPDIE